MMRKILAVLALLLCITILFGCADTSTRRKKRKSSDDDEKQTTSTTSDMGGEEEEEARDPELERFASMTETEIAEEIFAPAITAYGCFDGFDCIACNWDEPMKIEGMTYFKALPSQSEFDSALDFSKYENFRTYLTTLFTESFVSQLLDTPMYVNAGGDLYCMPAGRGSHVGYLEHHYTVGTIESDRVVYLVEVQYVKDEYMDMLWTEENYEITDDMIETVTYEFARVRENGRWVFNSFELWY